jgi:hypothetical protein
LVAANAVAALLVTCALIETGHANPVNAESLTREPFEAGLSGGLSGRLSFSRGNVDYLDVGGSGQVQYQTLFEQADAPEKRPPFVRQRIALLGSSRFAERSSSAFVNQAFVHTRWTAMWHRRVGSDVFAQYQFDEFLSLQARAVAGLGPRVEIVHTEPVIVSAGSGYMFEYNRLRDTPELGEPRESIQHRWTNYLAVRLALTDDQLLLKSTVYVQPRFDDFTDYRLLGELEALAPIGRTFAFGATMALARDSRPPTGVEEDDLRLSSTLRWSF